MTPRPWSAKRSLLVGFLVCMIGIGADPGVARPPDDDGTLAAYACSGVDDYGDPDVDGLTTCLETNLMHTAPTIQDTDADGISDGLDLMRQKSVGDVPLEIKIVTIRETTKKCDMPGTRYWDPFVSTGFVALPTLEEEGRVGHFEKNGFTKGSHKHDKKTIEPESLIASIQIPENIALYDLDGVLEIPKLNLKIGLYDHDGAFHDAVDMGIAVDGVSLPITLTLSGDFITRSFVGVGDTCSGRIDIQIQTPLTVEEVLASVIAKLGVGSGEGGAASMSDISKHSKSLMWPDGTGSNEINMIATYPGHNLEQASTAQQDLGEFLNPTHHQDHVLWHLMPSGDLYGLSTSSCPAMNGWSTVRFADAARNGTIRAALIDSQGENASVADFSVHDVNGFFLPPLEWCGPPPVALALTLDLGSNETKTKAYTFDSPPPSILTETQSLVVLTDDGAVLGWERGWLWEQV